MTKKILPPGYPDVVRADNGECLKRRNATLNIPDPDVEVIKTYETCEDCEACSSASACAGRGDVFWASVMDARQELVDLVLFWASYQKIPTLFPGKAYDGSTCPEGTVAELCATDQKIKRSLADYLTPDAPFDSCCDNCYYLWYEGQQVATLSLDSPALTSADYCTWASSTAVFGSWRLYTINGVWVLEDISDPNNYHSQVIPAGGLSPPPCPPDNIEFYKRSSELYANITITSGYGPTLGTYAYQSTGLYVNPNGSELRWETSDWKIYAPGNILVAVSDGNDINNPLDGNWTVFLGTTPVLETPEGVDLFDQVADIRIVRCGTCPECFEVDGATVVDVNGYYESVSPPAAPSPVACAECTPYITISGAGRLGADGTYAITTDNSALPLAPGQIACEYENTVSGWRLTKEFGIGKYELFDPFGNRTYTSTDGGATWPSSFVDAVDEPAPGPMSCYDEPPVAPLCRLQNTTGAGAVIDFYPTGHALGDNVYVISVPGFGVIYTSADGGATWVAESGAYGTGPTTFQPTDCTGSSDQSGTPESSTYTELAMCYVCTGSSSSCSLSSLSSSDSLQPCEECIRVSGSGPLQGIPGGSPETADGDYFPIDPGPFLNAVCVYQQPSTGYYIKQIVNNDTETWVITTETGLTLYVSLDGGATFFTVEPGTGGDPPVLEACTSSSSLSRRSSESGESASSEPSFASAESSTEASDVSAQPLVGVRYVRCPVT